MTLRELLSRPSAFTPFVVSGAALALIFGYVAVVGLNANPGGDEGVAARLFQLMMMAQVVIMAWFAMTWLPRAGRRALLILALQMAAATVPVAVILFLESL